MGCCSNTVKAELINKDHFKASISKMSFIMQEFQENDRKPQNLKQYPKDYKDVDRVLHYQDLSFVSEFIKSKIMSCHHNDLLSGHIDIAKTRGLKAYKQYLPTLWHDVKT